MEQDFRLHPTLWEQPLHQNYPEAATGHTSATIAQADERQSAHQVVRGSASTAGRRHVKYRVCLEPATCDWHAILLGSRDEIGSEKPKHQNHSIEFNQVFGASHNNQIQKPKKNIQNP
jgi:hypothetical protein